MPSPRNHLTLAVAGSGKTTDLVSRALAAKGRRILLTTYTLENVAQLEECVVRLAGCVPPNITVMSWFAFLLRDGVRPYQRDVFSGAPRVHGLFFDRVPAAIGRPSKTEARYFLTKDHRIYRDRTSEFAVLADDASGGWVVQRLEQIYDAIFIDEIQDISGYDLDLLERLFRSKIEITCSGDLRQTTYHTNDNPRHKQYRGANLLKWFEIQKKASLLEITTADFSHRCNEHICHFASAIFPEMPQVKSCECADCRSAKVSHVGIHFVHSSAVNDYVAEHEPRLLRFSAATTVSHQQSPINFGECKGRTYDHVLIFPTKKIQTYLRTGNPTDIGSREKFYVAVTRARHSVGIVIDAAR